MINTAAQIIYRANEEVPASPARKQPASWSVPRATLMLAAYCTLTASVRIGSHSNLSAPTASIPDVQSFYRDNVALLSRAHTVVKSAFSADDLPETSSAILRDAELFIATLPVTMISAPFISLAGDGELNFFWNNDDYRVDLGLYGDGKYSFYAKPKKGDEVFGDDILVSSLYPKLHKILIGKAESI